MRLEPLQQPARRYAQEQLCRKLSGLGAKIPGGKWLRIEVGDSYFMVYVFEKAVGNSPRSDTWDMNFFEKWGQTIGRMHRRTKTFAPSDEAYRRFHWYDDYAMNIETYIPASQPLLLEKCLAIRRKLYDLPRDDESYGLIHCDMHHGNFYVENGNLTVFDFDDCRYHWFAFDIAIPLFYVLRDARIDPNDSAFAAEFMTAFMRGYRRENEIDRSWLERLPLFLKVREMELYIVLLAEGPDIVNDWCRRFLDNRRESIEQEKPIIELDFSSL